MAVVYDEVQAVGEDACGLFVTVVRVQYRGGRGIGQGPTGDLE